MNIIASVYLLLLGLVFAGLIIYTPISIVIDIYKYIIKNHFNGILLFIDLKPRYRKILETYSNYYHMIPQKKQRLFRARVAKFIAMKEFVVRGDLPKVTDEMKVLIGSLAIQLTYGHPNIYFQNFYKILIYPDSYYSEISKNYHHGEVSPRGYIILSWKNFLEGWIDRKDGTNLGLHEMAHALHLENAIRNEEYDFLDFEMLKMFDREASVEIEKIRNGETPFFRAYAGTNKHEFFAVMIENFFERPSEFKTYNASLYSVCCKLLNQNPLQLHRVAG